MSTTASARPAVRHLQRDFVAALAIHALDRDGEPYVLMLGNDPGMETYHYWTEGREPSEPKVAQADW